MPPREAKETYRSSETLRTMYRMIQQGRVDYGPSTANAVRGAIRGSKDRNPGGILEVTLVATLLVASPAFNIDTGFLRDTTVNGGCFNITIGGIIQE
jgi:hypothetical protein